PGGRRRSARGGRGRGCAHTRRQQGGARRTRRRFLGAAHVPRPDGDRCRHTHAPGAARARAVPGSVHRRCRARPGAWHVRPSLRDARVRGQRRSLRARGAPARVARPRVARRWRAGGAADRHSVPPRAAGRGRSRARHGHDELADPDGHRAHSGAAGHSHRHPYRVGAEHRHGDRRRPHRWRWTRDLRVSGDRADGHRPGAARGDSDRGTGLFRRRGTRCAGGGPGSGAAMISVENLSKQYGATTVVDGVSMVIERNSITVIVGTSGSGKSTLLRMINRLIEPTRGRVLIDGHDTTGEPAHLLRRRIGYAIQGHGLFPHRTVAENIATVPRLLGWDEARIRARVEELLLVFQLDPGAYAGAFPHQLSGGQQQRVGVARALAAGPAVLLMDEPFGALDPIIRAKAQDDLLDIQRRFGTTIVLVTHDMDEAFRLGDRVAVMSHGRLLQYDRPAVLLTRPADPFVSRMTGVSDRAMRLLWLTTA